jgi:hypothetical protein
MSAFKGKPTYDGVWKTLPDIFVLALVGLVVQGLGATLIPWKTDIKVVFDRDLDNVYLVDVNDRRMLLFVEYQTNPDGSMPLRMFHYAAALKLVYFQQYHEDIPVLAVVVWANRGTTPAPTYASMATDTAGMTFTYHEIHLSTLDWQTVNPLLLVMAPFLRGFTQDKLEAAADEIIANTPVEHQKLLIGALLMVSRRKFRRFKNFAAVEQAILQKVKTTLNFIMEAILEDPDFAQLMASKAAEAEARGEAEGIRQAIAVFWQSRYGTLPPDVVAALARMDIAGLRPLLVMITTATEADARLALGL